MVQVFHRRKNQYTERWLTIPEGHRECSKCKQVLPLSMFNKAKNGAFGTTSVCKPCFVPISRERFDKKSLEKRMVETARSRSKERGLICDIEETGIIIPEFCPILGVRLESSKTNRDVNKKEFRKDNSPSLDRIDSTKGYVKGNIRVVSLRGNLLKSNATVEEMRLILADLERIEAEKNK